MKKIKLSPSGSSRWLNCPGSIHAEKKYPPKNNNYALEGTSAHKLAEICLKDRIYADDFLGKNIEEIIVTEDMVKNINKYINYINKYLYNDSLIYVEHEVYYEKDFFDGKGTLDSCIINKNNCHIFDLKYGKGIFVKSKNNSQLNLYAIGLMNYLNKKNINCDFFHVHIVQPRINNYNNTILDVDTLSKLKKEYIEKGILATNYNAPRIPGEIQCHWCLAKNDCKPLNDYLNNLIFDKFDLLENNKITKLEKKNILDNYKVIQKYIDDIKNEVYETLQNGGSFYEYNLKKGKRYYRWKENSEQEMKEYLGDKIYEKKMITVKKAKEIFEEESIKNFIVEKEGKQILFQK